MKYFEKYVSNTLAGCSNQTYFITDNKNCEYTGRVFYKVFAGGKYNYSFLFSNVTDSSYREASPANEICEKWTILEMGVAVVKSPEPPCEITSFSEIELAEMQQITFGGKSTKTVMPGEFFTTDETELEAESGDFICVEITFKGTKIPFHDELQIPIFIYEDGKFVFNKKMPLPQMIGCERNVKKRIGFLGDSITQGIGATFNSYNHWCAKIAEKIGRNYSFWNLGIGCAKAVDAASDGAWLFKAKQCEFVSVCLGVNDIYHTEKIENIKKSLAYIVDELKNSGVRVGIFTPFPFDWQNEKITVWNELCDYIKKDLSLKCEYCFDTAKVAGFPDKPHMALYGGHPNDLGCEKIAEAFCKYINDIGFML